MHWGLSFKWFIELAAWEGGWAKTNMPNKKNNTEKRRLKNKLKRQRKAMKRLEMRKSGVAPMRVVRTSALVPKMVKNVSAYKGAGIVGKLASSIGLPYEMGMRMPTSDALPVSQIKTMDRFSYTARNTGNLAPPNWDPGDIVVHFLGHPACLGYLYKWMSGTSDYTLSFSNQRVQNSPPTYDSTGKWILVPAANYATLSNVPTCTWTLAACTNIGGQAIHGNNMAIGFDGGVPYLFLNEADMLTVSVTTGAHTNTGDLKFEFTLKRWVMDESVGEASKLFQVVVPVGALGGSTDVTSPSDGYYCLEFTDLTGAVTGAPTVEVGFADVSLTCADKGWAQIAMSDLDAYDKGDASIGHKCRLAGSSLLITNTSPMINRGGSVLAARQNNKVWYNFRKSDLAGVKEKYNGDAAVGVYTFRMFDDIMEQWDSACKVYEDSKAFNGLSFPLGTGTWDHVIQISTPGFESYNTFNFVFENNMEFITDSQRYAKSIATGSIMDLQAARRLINTVPEWFYENPTHAQKIYGFIKNLGKAALKNAPGMAMSMGTSYPMYAPLLMALGKALSNLAV